MGGDEGLVHPTVLRVMMVCLALEGSLMDLAQAFGATDVAEVTARRGTNSQEKEARDLMLTMIYSTLSSLLT